MKTFLPSKKYLLLLVGLIFTCEFGYAQVKSTAKPKVIISTKVVYLHYNKQQQYADVLKIPVISPAYPNLKKALCDTLLFDGRTLSEVIKAFKDHESGITGSEYEVTFLNDNVISIVIRNETMGAYPDSYEKWLTFNIHTGKPCLINTEITPQGLSQIFSDYKVEMRARIAADKKDFGADMDQATVYELNEAIDSLKITELANKYVFTTTGMRFSIEKILPHVIQNMEPPRDYDISYAELKKYRAPTATVLK